jgi:sarcosine oxidase
MEEIDVAIVGAGVVGLSAAWWLGRFGREVTVFERFPIGHDRGSSHGPTRIFRVAYDDPVYVGLAQHALPEWRALEAWTGERFLEITEGFDVGDLEYIGRCEAAMRSVGAFAERLTSEERRDIFPWFEGGDDPALLSRDTGVLAADIALRALAQAARSQGPWNPDARIVDETPIDHLEILADGVHFRAGDQEVRAKWCVFSAGAWTSELLRPLGIDLPLRVTREQVFYFRAASSIVPFIHRGDIARYGVPMFGNASGAKIAEHMTGVRTTADARDFEPDPRGAARIVDYVRATLPTLDPEPVGYETCLYTTTPDEGFLIDSVGPLVIASACSGHGFKFGSVIGELVASLITGEASPLPLEPFSLRRFEDGRPG